MPESFGESVISMEQLLANAEPRVAEQPLLQEVHSELKTMLGEVRELRTRQREARATAQSITKEMQGKLAAARDQAARLRAGLTTMLGKRDERLVEFGMKPLRRRARRSKGEEPPEVVASRPEPARGTKDTH